MLKVISTKERTLTPRSAAPLSVFDDKASGRFVSDGGLVRPLDPSKVL